MKKFFAISFAIMMAMSVSGAALAAEPQGCYAQRVCQEIY